MTDQSPCTVVEAVRQDLLDRSRVGVAKYGTTLGNAGLSQRQILQHAYEEALDLANYLKTEIMRLDDAGEGMRIGAVLGSTKYPVLDAKDCSELSGKFLTALSEYRPAIKEHIISTSQYAEADWNLRPYVLTEEAAKKVCRDLVEEVEQKPSDPVACEDAPIDVQSGQEIGWTQVGNKGWRKGKVAITIQWQPFNRKDMILVNDGVMTYYATDLTDAFKMGERLL